MRVRLLLFYSLFLWGSWVASQENYGVGYATYIQKMNPSYFGFNNLNKVGVLYNSIVINQSTQLDTKYVFGSLSFDELKFSLGFDINSFRIAESGLTMNDFQLTYVYKIQVQNDLFLLPSVTMGFSQSKLETQNLIFGDQLNAVSGFFSTETLDPLSDLQGAISYFDFTASLLLHNNQYMVGMSFQHLNRPNKSFNNELSNPLPIHYEILGGYEFNLNPFENNLLPGYSYLFAFASLGLLQNQKFLYTAQEAQLGAFSVGINQKTILNNGFSFNNIGFSLGMSVENFDFGLFYQLPSKTKKLSTPSIFELQVTFNFSKYRRNNRGFYKRLQTDNYF